MRSAEEFLKAHETLLTNLLKPRRKRDPGIAEDMDASTLRALARVDLCCHFLCTRLRGEGIDAVPAILLAYPALLGRLEEREATLRELAALRHLCHDFRSRPAWEEAVKRYARAPALFRCYDIDIDKDDRPRRRADASEELLSLLTATLREPVPWVPQKPCPAAPGEYEVPSRNARFVYRVPEVALPPPPQHEMRRRQRTPPIHLSWERLRDAAARVDKTEADETWPSSALPPLNLAERLSRVRVDSLDGKVVREADFTLDGALHLVGMPSSGKSSLLWAMAFALAAAEEGHRLLIIANDTVQAATMAARFRRHGVRAIVLSSARARKAHVEALCRARNAAGEDGSMTSSADLHGLDLHGLDDGFSLGCALNGCQEEFHLSRGRDHAADPPALNDICHGLLDGKGRKKSCPLWPGCPAQEQQREAATAGIVIMTPAAFVHMTPDRWVASDLLPMAELAQFRFDVVLIDEADAVQKTLDEIFAPTVSLMSDGKNYLIDTGSALTKTLWRDSGAQFQDTLPLRWSANYYEFSKLVGKIYYLFGIDEAEFLDGLLGDALTPFTDLKILFTLVHRRAELDKDLAAAWEDVRADVMTNCATSPAVQGREG